MTTPMADKVSLHSNETLKDSEGKKIPKYSVSQLTRTYYISSLGIAAYNGANLGVFDLQSSINIEMGLGITSMMTMSVLSILSSLLLLPFVLNLHGPKKAIILAQISGGLYALCNFYPSWFTLPPGAILIGLTDGFIWTGSFTLTNFVGEQSAVENNEASRIAKISHFFGVFYALMNVGQLLGSGLSYMVLSSMKEGYGILHLTNNATTDASNLSDTSVPDWSLCFANDCQVDYIYNITEQQLDSYRPVEWSIYILMGIFTIVQIGSAAVSYFFLPRVPAKYDKVIGNKKPNVCSILCLEIKKTIAHFFSLEHLLIFPTYFYVGLNMAFYVLEYNRAYISCTIGVESIGLYTAINGISGMITSTFVSYCAPKTGQIPVYLTAVVIDITFSTIGLVWSPDPSNIYVLYILSAMSGATFAIWWIEILTTTSVHFSSEVAIGFSTQLLSISIAIVVANAWSIPLCNYEKIYAMLGILFFSTVCRGIAEVRLRWRRKKGATQ